MAQRRDVALAIDVLPLLCQRRSVKRSPFALEIQTFAMGAPWPLLIAFHFAAPVSFARQSLSALPYALHKPWKLPYDKTHLQVKHPHRDLL
jgi:hypothetical protein